MNVKSQLQLSLPALVLLVVGVGLLAWCGARRFQDGVNLSVALIFLALGIVQGLFMLGFTFLSRRRSFTLTSSTEMKPVKG